MIMVQVAHFFRVVFVFERVFPYFFGNHCTLGINLCRYLVLKFIWYHASNNGKYAEQCNKAFPLGQDNVDFVEYKIQKNYQDQLTLLQLLQKQTAGPKLLF